jgi:uncharacterized repeat protein (TIGR01451 family)
MKPTFYQFLKQRALRGNLLLPCLVFATLLLVGGQKAQAQLYSVGTLNTGVAATAYYDIATNTWTQKLAGITPAGAVFSGGNQMISNGTYMYSSVYFTGNAVSGAMYRYDVAANTWSSILAPRSGWTTPSGTELLVGDDIYSGINNPSLGTPVYLHKLSGTGQNVAVPSPNTYTQLAGNPANARTPSSGTYINGYIYGTVNSMALYRYNIATNTWLTRASAPGNMGEVVSHNGLLYAIKEGTVNPVIYRFNDATNTWTTLAGFTSGATSFNLALDPVAGKCYAMATSVTDRGKLWVYDIATNVWTAKAANTIVNSFGKMGLAIAVPPPACTITATPTATKATCTALVANADAKLELTAHAGGGTKVGYSIGSSYTGAPFATATTLTAAPFTVASALPNPSVNQPYTIRIYKDATCYKDYTVMLEKKVCPTADLAVSVATTPQTANQGETLTYTVTVTNNGPDTSPSVMVDVPLPANVTYLNGTASQGAYSTVTKKWTVGSMANAATNTLVLSLKVN